MTEIDKQVILDIIVNEWLVSLLVGIVGSYAKAQRQKIVGGTLMGLGRDLEGNKLPVDYPIFPFETLA